MAYDFTLDKKALISLVASWVIIGLLLFVAGWIIGMHWTTGVPTEVAASESHQESAKPPKEPVLVKEDEAEAPLTAPSDIDGAPKAATPGEALATNGTASAAVINPNATPTSDGAGDGQVKIVQESSPEPVVVSEGEGGQNYIDYTVQVGVFLDADEASRLLHAMESKGYAPTFFAGRDAENRQWYAVRVGTYADKQQATQAAANFTKQEKIKAVVRPLRSL